MLVARMTALRAEVQRLCTRVWLRKPACQHTMHAQPLCRRAHLCLLILNTCNAAGLVANLGDGYVDEIQGGRVTAQELNNVGFFFIGKPVSSLLHDADIWMKGDASTNLLSVVTEGFQIGSSKVHHRIYVCDPNKPAQKNVAQKGSTTVVNNQAGTEREAATSWRPTDVVSQIDVVQLLWEHRDQLGLATNATLEELDLADGACLTVSYDTPAVIAFDHMAVDHKSSVGIVDADGKLIGNLSASDIRALPFANYGLLLLPVYQYVAVANGVAGVTVEQVMGGAKVEGPPAELLGRIPLATVTPASSFAELLFELATANSNRGLHRVYVVADNGKPASIVTLTDVLRCVVRYDASRRASIDAGVDDPVDLVMFDGVKSFLESETLTHFIATHQHPLATVEKTASVGAAMTLLQRNKVLSCPVLDEDGEYAGAISVNDVLKGLHRTLVANLGDNYIDEVEGGRVTAEELNNVGFFFIGKPVSTLLHDADIWMKGDASTNLLSVVTEGFQIKTNSVHHRIYVCDPNKPMQKHVSHKGNTTVVNHEPGSEREGSTSWRPTDVVSQIDMIKLLWEHRDTLGLSTNASVRALGLADGACLSVPLDTPAVIAFDHMAVDHKSSVGIVDADGKLIGNLSASDIRDVPLQNFGLLLLPVYQYIAVVNGVAGVSVDEIAAGKQVPGTPHDLLAKLPVVTVRPRTTFCRMLEKLATFNSNRGLHRVYVVDESNRPLSIVTLTDVLRTIVRYDDIPITRRLSLEGPLQLD